MNKLQYLTADVFTDRQFGGNQLAVFPDARDLDDATMQLIARELNLSETVFVRPPVAGGTKLVRIFTPSMELPFAGHPTVGTAVILAETGAISGFAASGKANIVLEEGVGPVAVSIERQANGLTSAKLTSARVPEAGPLEADHAKLAALLGLPAAAVAGAGTTPGCYSAGVPFTIIAVKDEQALSQIVLDTTIWRESFANSWAPHIYALTMSDWNAGNTVVSRMFAPAMGIPEDPATGAAAVALAGYLVDRQKPADGTATWTISQGEYIGRPSTIILEADVAAGRATAVRVGGSAVIMSEGTFHLAR